MMKMKSNILLGILIQKRYLFNKVFGAHNLLFIKILFMHYRMLIKVMMVNVPKIKEIYLSLMESIGRYHMLGEICFFMILKITLMICMFFSFLNLSLFSWLFDKLIISSSQYDIKEIILLSMKKKCKRFT